MESKHFTFTKTLQNKLINNKIKLYMRVEKFIIICHLTNALNMYKFSSVLLSGALYNERGCSNSEGSYLDIPVVFWSRFIPFIFPIRCLLFPSDLDAI